MEECMRKLVVTAALVFALTGATAHVSYAGPCGDSNCTRSDNNKTVDASKPSGDGKESCSQSKCRNDDREDHRQAAKDAAKEAARAAAKAIFETVKARNSSSRSRDDDNNQSN
jgi:hypothetical protein